MNLAVVLSASMTPTAVNIATIDAAKTLRTTQTRDMRSAALSALLFIACFRFRSASPAIVNFFALPRIILFIVVFIVFMYLPKIAALEHDHDAGDKERTYHKGIHEHGEHEEEGDLVENWL